MKKTKKSAGGVSVYISKDIVEALEKKQKGIEEAGIKAGLEPLCLVKPSIGWMVRFQLRATLGLINGVE